MATSSGGETGGCLLLMQVRSYELIRKALKAAVILSISLIYFAWLQPGSVSGSLRKCIDTFCSMVMDGWKAIGDARSAEDSFRTPEHKA
jgi:hypothetical protein